MNAVDVLAPTEAATSAAHHSLRGMRLGRTQDAPEHEVTIADAARAWLAYIEHEKARAASTVRDYRNTVSGSILPHFG